MNNRPIISLISDFGLNDEYVGTIKGVILGIQPQAQLVDITHAVPPQDIAAAAFILNRAYPYFPARSIHMVIVDPGVGSSRSLLLIEADDRFFIGPDNGVLTPILSTLRPPTRILRIKESSVCFDSPSHTFHGRDIIAPIAARLACGMAIENFGEEIACENCQHLPSPQLLISHDRIEGEVIHIDHFGNLCTNVTKEILATMTGDGEWTIRIGRLQFAGIRRCYAEGPTLGPLALFDSHNHLEIAYNGGSARENLNAYRGMTVHLERLGKR